MTPGSDRLLDLLNGDDVARAQNRTGAVIDVLQASRLMPRPMQPAYLVEHLLQGFEQRIARERLGQEHLHLRAGGAGRLFVGADAADGNDRH